MEDLPQEELCIIHPLVDELRGDGLWAMWEANVLQSVEQQGGVIVQCRDANLQAHGPQLAGLHTTRQPLQDGLHKQGDTLTPPEEGRENSSVKQRQHNRHHSYIHHIMRGHPA